MELRVQGSGFRVQGYGLGLGPKPPQPRNRSKNPYKTPTPFRPQTQNPTAKVASSQLASPSSWAALGFRVLSLRFGVQGLGLRFKIRL